MNSRSLFAPPKHRLAHVSGRWILPMRVPSGAKMCTPLKPFPPHPAADQTLPSTSQRMPSEDPGDMFTNMRPCAIHNVINPNRNRVAWVLRNPGIYDVKQFLVGREAQPIWLYHIADNNCC